MAYEDYVVRPEENYRGMSYGAWAASWSNWLFSEDADRNEAEGPIVFLRGNIDYKHSSYEKPTGDDNSLAYHQDTGGFYDRRADGFVVIPRYKAILVPVLTAMEFIGGQYGGK